MTRTLTVRVDEVVEGDTLAHLDNAYVFEVESDPVVSLSTGRFSYGIGEDMVLVTFHDAEGDENYLLLRKNHPIEVERG